MQLATGYMNLALPSNFARMAINIRFFQRQGVPPTTAVTAGAIDSFVSTVVQAVLLGLLRALLGRRASSFDLEHAVRPLDPLARDRGGAGGRRAHRRLAVRKVRNAILERVRTWWPDVRRTIEALRAGRKLGLLLGGSLATELLFATALGVFANAFGHDIALVDLLADQHQRLAARELRPGPRRHRRRGVRPHGGADRGRDAGGGGARDRTPLPRGDVLRPPAVGLLRDALAAAQRLL